MIFATCRLSMPLIIMLRRIPLFVFNIQENKNIAHICYGIVGRPDLLFIILDGREMHICFGNWCWSIQWTVDPIRLEDCIIMKVCWIEVNISMKFFSSVHKFSMHFSPVVWNFTFMVDSAQHIKMPFYYYLFWFFVWSITILCCAHYIHRYYFLFSFFFSQFECNGT